MTLVDKMEGTMCLQMGENSPVEIEIRVDFKTSQIRCTEEGQESSLMLKSIEAVDQAELIYSIIRKDVLFMSSGNTAYI